MKKPWAGRFKEKTATVVEAFTESVSFDWRLWPYDIAGSIAHARMLVRQGIISKEDGKRITSGLREIAGEIEDGKFLWSRELEDVHMNIEAALIKKIGPAGGKLHAARSRNDQVALDMRLYLREEIKGLMRLLGRVQKALLKTAEKSADAYMPGYTHMQRAQPVTLGHHLLAYIEMFQRDRERFGDVLKRVNILPLGACALSGTSLPIDRIYVSRILGFNGVAENSMDAVSDRDFAIEFISSSAITMMHLSRLAEEFVLWSTAEFSFIELPDAFTTGSSIMPQKKNPDVAELIRGKTGRLYGALMNLLTTMKALPLTYNRDMQEDKAAVFDAADTLSRSLVVTAEMLPRIRFNKERMREASTHGYALATDIAEYLVRKGMPFREGHEVVGRIVRFAIEEKKDLNELSIEEMRGFSPLIGDDIYASIDLEASVKGKASPGGTSPDEVKRQISKWKKRIA